MVYYCNAWQQVDALKRQRSKIVDELKTVTQTRRREADLQTLGSEVSGLENRLSMTKRSREIAVSNVSSNENYNILCSP